METERTPGANAIVRWGGLSALILAFAYVVDAATDITIRPRDGGIETLLKDIDDNRELFLFNNVWAFATQIFSLPLLVGLYFALRHQDRPYMVLAGLYIVVGTVLFAAKQIVDIPQAEVASIFTEATGSAREAAAQDGEVLVDLGQGLRVGGLGAIFIAGLTVLGLLLLRSSLFGAWLGWLALATAALQLVGSFGIVAEPLSYVSSAAFAAYVVWLLGIGLTMFRKAEKVASERSFPSSGSDVPLG